MREIVGKVRSLVGKTGPDAIQEAHSLRERIWEHLQKGELNELQVEVMLRALEEVQNEERREPM